MRRPDRSGLHIALVAMAVIAGSGTPGRAATDNGTDLPLHSNGSAGGTSWTLSSDGYLGTYIQLSQPAPVSFTLNASGAASAGLSPDMTLSIANLNQSFSVGAAASNYNYITPTLPAGTYFVRVALDNQNAAQTPTLSLGSLQASGTGVTINNTASDANALAAAQTYIDNFRQGTMNITLNNQNSVHLPAGIPVQVKLVQNGFSLGSATYDTSEQSSFYNTYPWLTATSASTGNAALAYKYQQFVLNNFNITEPENNGKWGSDEQTQGSPNLSYTDQLENFAASHNINLRMHNLIWNSQQPNFVNSLFTANNVSGLNAAVTSRIGYYVSGLNSQAGPLQGKARDLGYTQLDVLNEGAHASTSDNYITTLGYAGVANIYKQAANAVAATGANTLLYTNEYNVLQNSSNPSTHASDPYANWYLNEIENINNAGSGKVVTGVGSEFYVTSSLISPSTMQQAIENLTINSLPLSITEFAISSSASASNAATDLQNAFTMIYGNPNATTFNFWDFWQKLEQADTSFLTNYQGGALMDVNGNPTALFTNTFLPLMAADNFVLPGQITPFSLTTDASGQIHFTGTYGTYDVTVNGQDYLFSSSAAGNSLTVVTTPEPASLALLASAAVLLVRRQRARGGPARSA